MSKISLQIKKDYFIWLFGTSVMFNKLDIIKLIVEDPIGDTWDFKLEELNEDNINRTLDGLSYYRCAELIDKSIKHKCFNFDDKYYVYDTKNWLIRTFADKKQYFNYLCDLNSLTIIATNVYDYVTSPRYQTENDHKKIRNWLPPILLEYFNRY